MKQFVRLTLFLLLNIFVSACTIAAVLIYWDRTRGPTEGGIIPPLSQMINPPDPATSTPPPADTPTPALTPTPAFEFHQVQAGETFESIAAAYNVSVEELMASNGFNENMILGIGETLRIPIRVVEIQSVVGAGDVETEHVVLRSLNTDELSLAGWKLESQAGQSYTFPQVVIYSRGGEVNVYSRAGTDTVSELFWGLTQPAWQSGEMVTLRDGAGAMRATYLIP